jgi:hypothetical protein
MAARRAEGRRRGGVNCARVLRLVTLPPDAPDIPLATVQDVATLLGATIAQVRKGTIDCRVGNCIGQLAGVLLKAMEAGDLERRLEALEARAVRGRVA